jgi:hypothetical protein
VAKTDGLKEVRSKTYFLPPEPAAGTCYLGDVASIIRSKNAGPYELTFDVMFDDDEIYAKVKNCGILTQATVAQLHHIDKKTFLRPCSGTLHALSRPPSIKLQFPDHLVRPILMVLSSTRHFRISCCLLGRVSLANGAQAEPALEHSANFANGPSGKPAYGSLEKICELDLEEARERLRCEGASVAGG